jgi:hypothetical protein
MNTIQLNFEHIKKEYPRAWQDFVDFHAALCNASNFSSSLRFEDYPFEYQLGVFFRYFNENGIELDVCNIEYDLIPSVIEENFKGHNQSVAHFS